MKKILVILLVLISTVGYSQKNIYLYDIGIKGNSLIDFKNFNVDLIESLVLKRINEYRKLNNKIILTDDNKIKNVARSWSVTMDSLGMFKHNKKYPLTECIQIHTNNADPITYNKLSEELFITWRDSEKGHKWGLLDSDAIYGTVGVSYKYEKCTQPTNSMFNDVDWCATFKKPGTFYLHVTFNCTKTLEFIR